MGRGREFDAVLSQGEIEQGIARMVGKNILETANILQDFDDASEAAGRTLATWIQDISSSETFKATIKAMLGSGKFNEEFFQDGFKEGLRD